ncbi:MAG: ComEC/Rec2 family competence protein [Candidatus Sericytochromatia bacterium]|nr:ComEC/Rec2 family competence protein [Candidatus Sericytochromatia bacterium]
MLAALALTLVAGAALGGLRPPPAVVVLVVPLAAVAAWRWPGRVTRVCLLIGLLAGAAAWRGVRAPLLHPADLAHLAPRRHLAVEVIVEGPPEGGAGAWRALCRAPAGPRWGSSRVLVRFPSEARRPAPGERWRLAGRLVRFSGPMNPGAPDVRAIWAARGVHATLRASEGGPIGRSRHPGDRARAAVDALRLGLLRGLAPGLSAERHALLGSLLLGAGAAPVPEAMAGRFRDAGLAHLLAASGAQVALLGGLVVALVRGLGGGPILQAGLGAAGLVLYLALTGGAPGMVRATLMGLVGLAGLVLEASPVPFAALWVAVAGLVVIDPACVADLGFQFSVLATYALLRLAQACAWAELPGPAWLWAGLATPIVTWAWVTPWQAHVFHVVPLAGIPANWASGPLIGWLTPWSLGVAVLGAAWPGGAALANHLTALGLAALEEIAARAVAVPGQLVPVPAIPPLALGGIYLALACGLARWRWALVSLGLALCCWPASSKNELHVAVLAVGQGDAIVIRTPGGAVALVDGGPAGAGSDAGARVVLPHLRQLGVRRLALVVASHPHMDHVGGLPAVVRALPVDEAWEAGVPAEGAAPRLLLASWLQAGVPWRTPAAGALVWRRDGVELRGLPRRSRPTSLNDASLVLRLRHGGCTMLLPGDLEAPGERDLVAGGGTLAAQVLKVGHHGARGSSSEGWLAAVRPALAIVSVGAASVHGHPHPEALGRLAAAGAEVLRTDHQGAILLRSDGRRWSVTDGRAGWGRWRGLSALEAPRPRLDAPGRPAP